MTRFISTRPAWFIAIVVIAGAALGAAGCAADTPHDSARTPTGGPTPIEPALRVVVLGDSLAAGLGLAESSAFPALVEADLRSAGLDVEVVNAGVSGDTSAGGLSRIDWVLQQRTDVLVVELGGNDALRGQPVENIEKNLRGIVQRGREAGARVILLGMGVPSNYGPDYGAAFAAVYPRVADEEGAVLVPDFVTVLGSDPDLLQPDGLHPNADGQRRLADALTPVLLEMLKEP